MIVVQCKIIVCILIEELLSGALYIRDDWYEFDTRDIMAIIKDMQDMKATMFGT